MTSNISYVFVTITLVGLFVIITVILNATTLGIIVKRFDELKINNQRTTTNQSSLYSSLVEATRITDVMGHLSELYRIAMAENGTRAINTRGFNRTLDYITNYLSTHTNYRITKTYFPIRSFQLASNPILLISINGVITNRTYSTNLSQAEFFYVLYSAPINLMNFVGLTAIPNVGCSNEDWLNANPSPSGRIALVKRGVCYFEEKAALAAQYNATGILIYNDGASSARNEPIAISLEQSNKLPALFLSFKLGQELVNALQNPAAGTSARIIINLVDLPPFPAGNICADTLTGDITQTIVVGSHSDGVPAGPGINDNGKFYS
jgi:hypothetical protein